MFGRIGLPGVGNESTILNIFLNWDPLESTSFIFRRTEFAGLAGNNGPVPILIPGTTFLNRLKVRA